MASVRGGKHGKPTKIWEILRGRFHLDGSKPARFLSFSGRKFDERKAVVVR